VTPVKRIVDVSAASLGLILLAPVFAVVAVVIVFVDGRPVLFRQVRVGRNGVPFRIFKFRTMIRNAEARGGQLTAGRDGRVTPVGGWLRRTKLDELPQLLNVLAGQMSLVGPRPEVPKYVEFYTEGQRRVLGLVPGITDPASVVFRDESSALEAYDDAEKGYIEQIMPEKIRLNLEYAARRNVLRDLGVICTTVWVVLFGRKDASSRGRPR